MTKIKNLDGLTPQAGTIGLDTEKALRTRQDSKTTDFDGHPSQGGADGSGTGATCHTHQDSDPESIINIVQNILNVNTKSTKNRVTLATPIAERATVKTPELNSGTNSTINKIQ
jgi:hypothetical protein